jgi:hypothetical protein
MWLRRLRIFRRACRKAGWDGFWRAWTFSCGCARDAADRPCGIPCRASTGCTGGGDSRSRFCMRQQAAVLARSRKHPEEAGCFRSSGFFASSRLRVRFPSITAFASREVAKAAKSLLDGAFPSLRVYQRPFAYPREGQARAARSDDASDATPTPRGDGGWNAHARFAQDAKTR